MAESSAQTSTASTRSPLVVFAAGAVIGLLGGLIGLGGANFGFHC